MKRKSFKHLLWGGVPALALAAALLVGGAWFGTSAVSAQSSDAERVCNTVVNYAVEGATGKGKWKDRDQRIALKSCMTGDDKSAREWQVTWIGHDKKKKVAVVSEDETVELRGGATTTYPLPKPDKVSKYWKKQAKNNDNIGKKAIKGDSRWKIASDQVIAHSRDGNYLAGKYNTHPDWALILVSEGHAVFCEFRDGFSCTTNPKRLVDYYSDNQSETLADLRNLGQDYLSHRDALLDVVVAWMGDISGIPLTKELVLALAPPTAPEPPSGD